MELIARVQITIKDEFWAEMLAEEERISRGYVPAAQGVQYNLGQQITEALKARPYSLGSYMETHWDKAEFIEFEERQQVQR